MTTPTESKRFDAQIVSCGATPAGAQWVKGAVDPFHDVDLDVIGMPDAIAGRSVVYAVTSNLVIDRPSGLNADTTWDCNIAFTPTITDARLVPFDALQDTSHNAFPATADYESPTDQLITLQRESALLTANAVESGEPTFFSPTTTNVNGKTCEYTGLGVNQFLDTDGSSIIRVTGAAFEVHNTTEDVYKSGSVTSYKIAREADHTNFTWMHPGTTTSGVICGRSAATISNGPPTSAATAKLYNGHTWDAREGCLVPGVLDAGESDGEKSLPRMHLVKCTHPDTGNVVYWAPVGESGTNNKLIARGALPRTAAGNIPDEYSGIGSSGLINPEYYNDLNSPPTVVPEMMTSGAYFTGLSAQTKLTLTLRVFVEVFPAAGNSLVPLAHPSNPYDAKAMQCYQEIMSHMRSGYRVADNDAGDYFKKAISAARVVSKIVGPALPPHVRMALAAAEKVADRAEQAITAVKRMENTAKNRNTQQRKVTNGARSTGSARRSR